MEKIRNHQQWKTRLPVCMFLLLMCMTVGSINLQEEKACPDGDYLTEEGICCNKCHPGFKLVEKCHATGQRSNCTACPAGQFTDTINNFPNCRRCSKCKEKDNKIESSSCKTNRNTVCECKRGYYKSVIDSIMFECLPCKKCIDGEIEAVTCAENQNAKCECQEKYHRVEGKCVPCQNYTEPKECSRASTFPQIISTSKTSNPAHGLLSVNFIVGAFAGGIGLLILVIIVTFVTTKWHTKQTAASLQPSNTAVDSCQEILVHTDEFFEDSNVKTLAEIPKSEQEIANLPDCIPLEIRISDLIYTVLDLVPVQQLKQLVRSLGLKDTEIEQVEMDHRSCKEAHYQMLRMWAERSPYGSGQSRGGMLHRPLLEELLDNLRNIHLGRAAEEIETKYGIQ